MRQYDRPTYAMARARTDFTWRTNVLVWAGFVAVITRWLLATEGRTVALGGPAGVLVTRIVRGGTRITRCASTTNRSGDKLAGDPRLRYPGRGE